MFKPARKITNTGTRKNTGLFPSHKNKRNIVYESLLELDYIHLLEFYSDVLSFQEQPFTIKYNIDSKVRSYTPDFFVTLTHSTQLIEIKPKAISDKIPSNEVESLKYVAASQYCASNGITKFRIVTDEEIISTGILSNLKFLFSYSHLSVPDDLHGIFLDIIAQHSNCTIRNILNAISTQSAQQSMYYAYILSMIYHQEVIVDLKKPISRESAFIIK